LAQTNSSRGPEKSSHVTTALIALENSARPQVVSTNVVSNNTFSAPHTLAELLNLSATELAQCDIARMNLLCAEGLPGAENLNLDESLAMLDRWAKWANSEATRNLHHFRENLAYYYNSENFYRMLMMSVVLYEDFKIRYNPKWIQNPSELHADDHFAADSRDILIHGLTGSHHMGTCSSMPVLYVALGRRLGFPLKLVTTKAHVFFRWDSPGERFDMEASGKGLDEYQDEHFKQWPLPVTGDDIKNEGYLQSLTPAQELSVFLRSRAMCLREAGRWKEAVAAHAAALKLEPNWRSNQILLAEAEQRLASDTTTAKPKNQPDEIEQLYQQAVQANRMNRAKVANTNIIFKTK
jgi:tetratricopeptide (TPR) repeat protein